jgi:hypothetical protein
MRITAQPTQEVPMYASTRKCTDTKPCQLMNCYACRRRLIDETAVRMMDAGCSEEAATQYRYGAINALAFEITPPAPQAPTKARKASETMTPQALEEALGALRKCLTRDGARKVLAWFTVVKLRQMAKAIELGGCSRYRKDELIEHLINFTVQMKLDHDAILKAK